MTKENRRGPSAGIILYYHTLIDHNMSSSWLDIPDESEFSLCNLPLSVFTCPPLVVRAHCATRLGDIVVDLSVLEEAGLFADIPGLSAQVFCQDTLNAFLEHSRPVWLAFRNRLTALFSLNQLDSLRLDSRLQEAAFHGVSEVQLHLPIRIGDYTDFYASREHATNVG